MPRNSESDRLGMLVGVRLLDLALGDGVRLDGVDSGVGSVLENL